MRVAVVMGQAQMLIMTAIPWRTKLRFVVASLFQREMGFDIDWWKFQINQGDSWLPGSAGGTDKTRASPVPTARFRGLLTHDPSAHTASIKREM